MKKQTYGILDIAKFISALLVIAIHCAPFIEIDETLNFVFVQMIARLAVPFFFITSGWLFFRKINPEKGWKDPDNLHSLQHYWGRIMKIYLIWSAIYLPLLLISWIQGGFHIDTLIRLARDVIFNGTYYHLWFLPALLLGVPIVYMMYTNFQKNKVLWLSLGLYLVGMVLNVYGTVLSDVPVLSSIISVYHATFATSRNGLFFAPVYLVLGIYAQGFLSRDYKKQAALAFSLSGLLYCLEAFILRQTGIMHDLTSMYLMLVPTVFFLFILLMQFHLTERKCYLTLRKMSLLLYVSHIYFIYLFLNILKLGNLPVYILSIVCSCMFALLIIKNANKYPVLKALM